MVKFTQEEDANVCPGKQDDVSFTALLQCAYLEDLVNMGGGELAMC
jgi:hypothetical protein